MKYWWPQKIGKKILLGFICFSSLPILVLAAWTSFHYQNKLKEVVTREFLQVATIKELEIEEYFEDMIIEVKDIRDEIDLIAALDLYSNQSLTSKENSQEILKKFFDKEITEYCDKYQYHDLMLIDHSGKVVYSVKEESDLGINLNDSSIDSTILITSYRTTLAEGKSNISSIDYYSYSNIQSGFITVPIKLHGTIIGVLAAQFTTDDLQAIVGDCTYLGETASVLLIEGRGRSCEIIVNSYDDEIGSKLLIKHAVKTRTEFGLPCQRSLVEDSGSEIRFDINGRKVLAVWGRVEVPSMGIVVKADVAELFYDVYAMQRRFLFLLLVILIIAVSIAYRISMSISKPVNEIVRQVNNLKDGKFDIFFEQNYEGEMKELVFAFAQMTQRLWERERKQQVLTETLAQSERKLASIFNSSNIGILTFALDGSPELVNERMLDIFGYTKEELDNFSIFEDMTYPEDVEKSISMFDKLINNEVNSYSLRKRYINKSRAVIWVDLSVTAVKDSHERVIYAVGVVNDVTTEYLNLEDLKKQQVYSEIAFELSQSGTWYVDIQNDASKICLSKEKQKLIGINSSDDSTYVTLSINDDNLFIDIEESRLAHINAINSVVSGEIDSYTINYAIRREDNSELRWLRSHATLIKDDKGNPSILCGVSQDVTEQKLNELHLAEANQRVLQALEIANAGTWHINYKDAPQKIIIDDQIERIFGMTTDDNGIDISDFSDNIKEANNKVAETFWEQFISFSSNKEALNIDATCQFINRTTNAKLWLRIMATVQRDEQGIVIYATGVVQDISDLKIRELELQRTNEFAQTALTVANAGSWYIDYTVDANLFILDEHSKVLLGGGFEEGESTITRAEYMRRMFAADEDVANAYLANIREYLNDHSIKQFVGEFMSECGGEKRWIRAHNSVKRNSYGDRLISIGLIQDITDQKLNELKIIKQREMSNVLTDISLRYINTAHTESTSIIEQALKDMAEYIGASRAYVVEYDSRNNLYRNTFEWYEDDSLRDPDNSQPYTIDDQGLLEAHLKGEYFLFNNVQLYASDQTKAFYKKINLNSSLTVPLIENGKLVGFWGFDSNKDVLEYAEWELALFYVFSEIISNIKTRGYYELELKEKSKSLAEAQHLAQLGNWRLDMQSGQVTWSDELYRLLGYAPREVTPNTELFYKHILDDNVIQRINDFNNPSQKDYFTYQVRRNDGELRYFRSKADVIKDELGEITVVVGIVEDISDQEKAKLTIADAKQKLNMALLAANMVCWEINISTLKLTFDGKSEILNGRNNFSLREWVDKIHPDDKASFVQTSEDIFENRLTDIRHSFRVLKTDGTYMYIMLIGNVERTNGTKAETASGIMWDISNIKTNEEKLHQAHVSLGNVLDSISVGIAIRGVNDKSFKLCNNTFYEMFDIPVSEQSYFSFRDVFRDDATFDSFEEQLGLDTAILYQEYEMLKHQSNDMFWVQLSSVPINFHGEDCILLCFYDFTYNKLLQIDIEAAKDAAEVANNGKSIFLANMSHEIRTPMNAVLGFSELLSKRVTDPVVQEFVSSIRHSGKTLLSLINDILDFSKIESGRFLLNICSTDIRETVNEVIDIYKITARKKGIILDSVIGEEVPQELMIDDIRLRQILINLIANAIKFTSQGSVVVSVLGLVNNISTCSLTFSVKDTGEGISEPDHDRIFEAFRQKDQQDNRRYEGTGLGLSISSSLVQMMGSKIQLESKKGQGSDFFFTLNDIEISNTIKKRKTDKDIKNVYFEDATIVVADDVEDNRQLIAGMLEDRGVTLHFAQDGIEAFDLCQQMKPNLVLLDVKMPKMDGIEVLAKLRSEYEPTDIPVIALSALVSRGEIEGFTNHGFDGLLAKPIEAEVLIRCLMNHLSYYHFIEDEQNIQMTYHIDDLLNDKKLIHILKQQTGALFAEYQEMSTNKGLQQLVDELTTIASAHDNEVLSALAQQLAMAHETINISHIQSVIEELSQVYNS